MQDSWKNNFISRQKNIRRIFLGSGVFLLALTVSLLSSSANMDADTSQAAEIVATIRNSGYNMSLSSSGRVKIDLDVSSSGTMAIVKDTVNVKSNASTGYKLFLSMSGTSSNDNRLNLNGESNASRYIPSTDASYDDPQPLQTNTWGFAVPGLGNFDASYDIENPNNSSKFASLPLHGHEALVSTFDTYTYEDGNNVDIYYGVIGDTTLQAGTYSNAILYNVVANSTSSDNLLVSASPSVIEKLAGGELITIATGSTALASSVLANTEAGMSPAEVKIGGSSCYNEELSNSDESSYLIINCLSPAKDSGIYDIAVSIPAIGKEYFIEGGIEYKTLLPYMQDITISEARNMQVGETITLFDKRDNKAYYVTKEGDGNLWMTQNLDLDLHVNDCNNTHQTTLATGTMGTCRNSTFVPFTDKNTDISTANWTIVSDGTVDNAGYDTQTTTGPLWNYYGSNNGTNYDTGKDNAYEVRSYDPGNKCMTYTSREGTDTQTDCDTTIGNSNHGHTGNYYNWPAATAGTGTFDDKTQYASVEDSICPSGWKLPTGSSSASETTAATSKNEWNILLNNVNFNISFRNGGSPISNTDPIMASLMNDNGIGNSSVWLTRAGTYDYRTGSMIYLGADGYYWSRSVSNVNYAYYLLFNSGTVYPGTRNGIKGTGFSVRCMKEVPETIADAPSMQKVTQKMVDNTPVGVTVSLVDERDGKFYYVTKQADGHVWMTQNLDLDLHVNDCNNTHQTTLTTGTMGTCKNGTFIPFTKDNTDISGDNWTIVSDGTVDNAGYDTQTAKNTRWNSYSSNNGTNYDTGKDNAYEVRSYDPGNKCMTYTTREGTDTQADCDTPLGIANHGHTGNYYNWPAATAGTGTFDDKTQYANVEDSICPSGWKLPTGRQSNTADNEWNVLLNKVNSSITLTTSNISNTDPIMASLMSDNGAGNSSAWLTRASGYHYRVGYMINLGVDGFYWSRSVKSDNNAYYLDFDSSFVRPSTDANYKGYGFPVRCRL